MIKLDGVHTLATIVLNNVSGTLMSNKVTMTDTGEFLKEEVKFKGFKG